jgi:formylglycine-generating enzyme
MTDEFTIEGRHTTNTWQGEFPLVNERLDGYEWTAPGGSFPPNGYRLFDMAGNVWEWTRAGSRGTARSGTRAA